MSIAMSTYQNLNLNLVDSSKYQCDKAAMPS